MKRLVNCLLLLFVCFSCTDRGGEGDIENFTVSINNSSNNNLMVKGYTLHNGLEFELIIGSMSVEGEVKYVSNVFDGYRDVDSIVFKFPNSKGYICALRENGTQFCFQNKSPFEKGDFLNIGNNTYEFEITQEDYDNAHDLPE